MDIMRSDKPLTSEQMAEIETLRAQSESDSVAISTLRDINQTCYYPLTDGMVATFLAGIDNLQLRQELANTTALSEIFFIFSDEEYTLQERLNMLKNKADSLALPQAYIDYFEQKVKSVNSKIETARKAGDVHRVEIMDVPDGDIVSMLARIYPNRTILVGFWATWCGPCKAAIRHMEPMKAEFADRNVVFVYLTDDSSPEERWQIMIADMPGEHVRFADDVADKVYKRYQISGIPFYLIINPQGAECYRQTGFPGVDAMRDELNKAMQQ